MQIIKIKKLKKTLNQRTFLIFLLGYMGNISIYLDISPYKGIFNRDVGNKKIEDIFRRRVGKTEPQV